MRFTKLFFLIFSIGLSTSILFTNCGEKVQLRSSEQTSSAIQTQNLNSSTPSTAQNPFENQKTQFNISAAINSASDSIPNAAQKMGLRTKTGDTIIPAGIRLVVVLYNSCANPSELYKSIQTSDLVLPIEIQTYSWLLTQDTSLESIQALAAQDPCIRGITNDGILKAEQLNDPLYNSMSGLKSLGHTNAMNFLSLPGIGASSPVTVAVIDSGVDYNHPDLKANILRNVNGQILGYDYKNSDTDPIDDFGHGTAVAGIIAAASNNGIGTTGVLGQNIKILAVKVQDNAGVGLISDITRGIDYSIANKVDVINISMAGISSNAALLDALTRAANAKIFVAVAAGNNGAEISTTNVVIPAFYGASISGVMTVGSINSGTSTRSSFSNYSSTYVEIFAPGSVGIYYPCLSGSTNCSGNGNYSSGSGTSYSSPMVAGSAALTISFLKANNIAYTAANIEGLLVRASRQESTLTLLGRDGRSLNLEQLAQYLRTAYSQGTSGGFDDF